jgi:hypothetical protein
MHNIDSAELYLLIVALTTYIEKDRERVDQDDPSSVAAREENERLLKRLNAMHEDVQEKAIIDIRVTKNR